jgi:hypothetical protein
MIGWSIADERATDWLEDMDNRISSAVELGWNNKVIKPDTPIVIVTGWRAGTGYTNTVRIIKAPRERPKKFQVLTIKYEGPVGLD